MVPYSNGLVAVYVTQNKLLGSKDSPIRIGGFDRAQPHTRGSTEGEQPFDSSSPPDYEIDVTQCSVQQRREDKLSLATVNLENDCEYTIDVESRVRLIRPTNVTNNQLRFGLAVDSPLNKLVNVDFKRVP